MTNDILAPDKEITNPRFYAKDGVAICLGNPANNMGTSSIMMKSTDSGTTKELRKQWRQVRVSLSMEEFLKQFYGLWGEDARSLAQILGFEVEYDEYDTQYYQDYIKEKVDSVEILKSIKTEEDFLNLDTDKQDALIELQYKYEKGMRSGTFSESKKEEVNKSSNNINVNENSENGEKDMADAEMQKQLDDLKKSNDEMAKLLKASEDARKEAEAKALDDKKDAELNKASELEFLSPEDKEMLKGKDLDTIVGVVGVLRKAQDKVKELEGKVAAIVKAVDESEESLMNKAISMDGEATDADDVDSNLNHMMNLAKSLNQ